MGKLDSHKAWLWPPSAPIPRVAGGREGNTKQRARCAISSTTPSRELGVQSQTKLHKGNATNALKQACVALSYFQSEVGEAFRGEIGGELPAKLGRRFSSFSFAGKNRQKHFPPKLHHKFHHQTSLRGSGLWQALHVVKQAHNHPHAEMKDGRSWAGSCYATVETVAAHKHKQFCPVTAWLRGGLLTGWPGVKCLCAVCGTHRVPGRDRWPG